MRIGILCHASFGGSARIATELAAELARRGNRVHLFTRTLPFGGWDHHPGVLLHPVVQEQVNDIHPARLHAHWSPDDLEALIARILNVSAHEGLDVLHFHYAVPFAFVVAEVRRRLRSAAPLLIGTLHGTDVTIFGREPDTGPSLAAALRKLDALTTVSQHHARLAGEIFQFHERPRVISNFVDLARFRPQGHTDEESTMHSNGHQRLPSKLHIVHISNFRPVKNPESVARIFLDIRAQMDAELWLIGDGQELDAVKSILNSNGRGNDVRYWGHQSEVGPILTQCHLLLITSTYESFCLAALEAQACGVPVLATEVGGLPEVVVNGKTGLLFPVGNHSMAVDQAISLLTDPTRYARMRQAAVRHARRFGHIEIVPHYEDLYRELLDKRTARPLLGEAQALYP